MKEHLKKYWWIYLIIVMIILFAPVKKVMISGCGLEPGNQNQTYKRVSLFTFLFNKKALGCSGTGLTY